MPADNFVWFPDAAVGGLLTANQQANQPKGETGDKWFKPMSAFEVKSISFGVEMAHTIGSGTSGAAAGKAKFQPIKLVKDVDQGSCPLFAACTAGAHFPSLYLAVRKTGGVNLVYLQYIFRMVFVTEIGWSGGEGEANPEENISFVYGAMGMQYIKQKPDGSADATNTMVGLWSTVTNKNTWDVPGITGSTPKFLTGADAQQV